MTNNMRIHDIHLRIHAFFISNCFISKSVLDKTKVRNSSTGSRNAKHFENYC